MANEKITTETASAVVPPAVKAEPPVDAVVPPAAEAEPPEVEVADPAVEAADDAVSVDAQQMAGRDREMAQFRSKATRGKPGRPVATRAGGYVLTKDGWVLDKKVTRARPGEPDVTFREGEGSKIQAAGGWQVGDQKGKAAR